MLNNEQEYIYKEFQKFLFDDREAIIIDGSGGTGKSYLINYLYNHQDEYFERCNLLGISGYTKWVITSTTNKACSVLRYCEGTIHSYLGLRVNEDFKTGEVKLKPNGKWRVHTNELIFIDECSMINDELLSYIDSATHNCKIVFIGDKCQLAPVKYKISPVYKLGLDTYYLTQFVRQKNTYLMDLASACKQAVLNCDNGTNNVKIPIQGNLLSNDLMKSMLDKFSDEDKVVAYTNKQVLSYINYIEKEVKHLPDTFNIGETYIFNDILENNTSIIARAEEKAVLNKIKTETDDKCGLDFYRVELEKPNGDIIHASIPVDYAAYKKMLNSLAKSKLWAVYFGYKHCIADIRPIEASTVHKSQGSTYKNVFIDMNDLSTCTTYSQFYRLLYVAATRATDNVYFYGSIKPRFGSYEIH